MKPPKRRPRTESTPAPAPAPAPTGIIRIGFAPGAKAVFERLSSKEQTGLRRKLKDFGANPAIGKPLVGELLGYHRVTYGRLRAISQLIVKCAEGMVIAHYIGPRKEGSKDDPYEVAAAAAIQRGDADAIAALEAMVQELVSGQLPADKDDED